MKLLNKDWNDNYSCASFGDSAHCCGVYELGNMEQGPWLKDCNLTVTRAAKMLNDESIKVGMLVAYLLPDQHDGDWGKILKAAGWKQKEVFRNPNTGNTLYFWYKNLAPVKPKKSKAKIVSVLKGKT